MDTLSNRPLTSNELEILSYIYDLYGDYNVPENVFITGNDRAVIFVKDTLGNAGLCVNLTTVAEMAIIQNLNREKICKIYLIP